MGSRLMEVRGRVECDDEVIRYPIRRCPRRGRGTAPAPIAPGSRHIPSPRRRRPPARPPSRWSCGGATPWSEHASGNAVDIAALVLADGTRISVLGDWNGENPDKALFLRQVSDGACRAFATVLGPDYNAAHRNHLHLAMAGRWGGVCG